MGACIAFRIRLTVNLSKGRESCRIKFMWLNAVHTWLEQVQVQERKKVIFRLENTKVYALREQTVPTKKFRKRFFHCSELN